MSDRPPTQDVQTYSNCLIKPMTSDERGRPIVKLQHVVDAALVAFVVFFSILLGDVTYTIFLTPSTEYITASDVATRGLTAGIAFGLTFFVQWARARGLALQEILFGPK